MDGDSAISGLMILRLGGVFLIAVVLFVWFMRKRSNRHPMEGVQERNIDEIRAGVPPRRE